MKLGSQLKRWLTKEGVARSNTATATAEHCHVLNKVGTVPPYEDILATSYRRFLKSGDVAVDIGVNLGLHFGQLIDCVGETGSVIGFEPVPDFVDAVRSRHGASIDLRQKALSSQPGRGQFLHMTKAIGESGFKERATEGDRGAKTIDVEISTLDVEFRDAARIDFIKIDTEGHELSALNGGQAVIARTRPVISIEYGRPTYSLYGLTAASLPDWANEAGYRISDLFGNLVRSREEWLYIVDYGYWDFFLVPAEKAKWWSAMPRVDLP